MKDFSLNTSCIFHLLFLSYFLLFLTFICYIHDSSVATVRAGRPGDGISI